MDIERFKATYIPYEGLDLNGSCAKHDGETFVHERDFDRILAERDALQQLLNARDEEIERLKQELADERLQSLADGAFAEYCADRENQA